MWVKVCVCGKEYDFEGWEALRPVGKQAWISAAGAQHPNVCLDLRLCGCGTTIAMPVAPWASGSDRCPVAPAATRAAAEAEHAGACLWVRGAEGWSLATRPAPLTYGVQLEGMGAGRYAEIPGSPADVAGYGAWIVDVRSGRLGRPQIAPWVGSASEAAALAGLATRAGLRARVVPMALGA